MKATGWIALLRSDETLALLENYPTGFLLLTQIAMRAKWKDCQITGLKAGEALIGDWRCAGLKSEKAYRHAKEILQQCGLATFKGRPNGTVACLVGSTIFSLSVEDRGGHTGDLEADTRATLGQTGGDLGATNNKERQKIGEPDTKKSAPPSKARGTIEELKAFAVEIGQPPEDGESMFHHWEANGWRNGQNPCKDWKAGIQKWKSSGWLPSQKPTTGPANRPTAPAGKDAGITENLKLPTFS